MSKCKILNVLLAAILIKNLDTSFIITHYSLLEVGLIFS
jgi:hypothetical protein